MTRQRSNWVVSISSETEDPLIFGPYTETRARELAEKIEARIQRDQEENEVSYDEETETYSGGDSGYIAANAYPLDNPGIRAICDELGL